MDVQDQATSKCMWVHMYPHICKCQEDMVEIQYCLGL